MERKTESSYFYELKSLLHFKKDLVSKIFPFVFRLL
jgi:hypothetical protein